MAITSLFGGLALANAGLGAVHGFAGPFGGMFPAPHGAVCASLLPHVMAVNIEALRQRNPSSGVLDRYDEIGQILIGEKGAGADEGVGCVSDLCDALQVPGLKSYGFGTADIPILIEKAAKASSMKGNPIELTYDEMVDLLRQTNEDGLVHTINIYGQICNCCEDCCGIFETFKMGAPTFIPSPFVARADSGTCIACGDCQERCPVDAICIDAFATVDAERCLGCGVCVPTCSTDTIKLVRRPVAE